MGPEWATGVLRAALVGGDGFFGARRFHEAWNHGLGEVGGSFVTACFVFPVWGTRQGTVEAGARRPDAWLAAELLAAWEEATNFPTKMRTCENMSQNRVAI